MVQYGCGCFPRASHTPGESAFRRTDRLDVLCPCLVTFFSFSRLIQVVILFADDTTLYASSDNIVNLYDLINCDLDNLTDWFRANKLSLNTSKTH